MKHHGGWLRLLVRQASSYLAAPAHQQPGAALSVRHAHVLAALQQLFEPQAAWFSPVPITAAAPLGWRSFVTSACSCSTSGNSGTDERQDAAGRLGADDDGVKPSASSSTDERNGTAPPGALQPSMDKLVDAAVDLVEQGRLGQAIDVLKQGIEVLQAAYPNAPELSELHNQVALLLFFADKPDEAATHAQSALEITSTHFGVASVLTGHRLLRLGTIRFGQGRPMEAAPLLDTAADMLKPLHQDPALAEAHFYRALLSLAAASSTSDIEGLNGPLSSALRTMVDALGGESMIVRLALAQHSRLVNRFLDTDFGVGEAAFKQHMALQEVQDPSGSPELGLTSYQLATLYYAHDLLNDAGLALQRAASVLRQHYPEDHDLLVLCRHRMGMVCATGRDPRAAIKLLQESRQHYAQQQEGHPLQHEADAGLAMAKFRTLLESGGTSDERRQQQQAALDDADGHVSAMAGTLGGGHMLVQGVRRYIAKLAAMAHLPR